MRHLVIVAVAGAIAAHGQTVVTDDIETPSASYLLLRAHTVNGGIGFALETDIQMTAGQLLYLCNQYQPIFGVDFAGSGFFAGDLNVNGQLVMSGGGSGAAVVRSYHNYLTLLGDQPIGYWGIHGAVTVGNDKPMIAGFIAEFFNPLSGTGAMSDKKFLINYQGAYGQLGGYCEAQFAPCGNYTNAPENDGGTGYYIATDAGVAFDGFKMFDVCTHRWKQCVVDGVVAPLPGGVWIPEKLVGD